MCHGVVAALLPMPRQLRLIALSLLLAGPGRHPPVVAGLRQLEAQSDGVSTGLRRAFARHDGGSATAGAERVHGHSHPPRVLDRARKLPSPASPRPPGEEVPAAAAQPAAARAASSVALLEFKQLRKAEVTAAAAKVCEGVEERPDFLCVGAFALLFAICIVKAWLSVGDSEYEEKSAEVRMQRDLLQGEYVTAVTEIEGILGNMTESSAYLAEWNFEEKRKAFLKFLDHVRQKPDVYVGRDSEEFVSAFRKFVGLWLAAFAEWSMDPLDNPSPIVTERDFSHCKSIRAIAELVATRLDRTRKSFIRLWLQQVPKGEYTLDKEEMRQATLLEFKPWLGCGIFARNKAQNTSRFEDDAEEAYPVDCLCGCVRLTVLSQAHLFVLLTLLLGLGTLALEIALGSNLVAASIGSAEVCLLIMLTKIKDIDEVARLRHEVNHLQNLSKDVEGHHQDLKDFYTKLRDLGHLWRYRTLPCLEHFEELQCQLSACPESERLELLQGMNKRWEAIFQGLGPLEMWVGKSAIEEDFLILAADQLNSATEFVEKQRRSLPAQTPEECKDLVLSRLSRVFGFVVIRILRANNLTNKGMGMIVNVSNPYVTLSMSGCKPLRTASVAKNLDPVWNEEFFIPVNWDQSVLELHVWSYCKMSDHPSLGFINVNFRDLEHGNWHHRREHLQSVKKGTQKRSEIEFEVYFASEVQQLSWVDSQSAAEQQRLTRFIR